ncbi:HK97-gp10 family putative phage morphogenesis protein [Listeria monocytogenes]|uniref:HK97-gp10 family putative phage morphogenesis protein n=1 Tax=Listeria monocytogenes TaxID=1639 RepID=UPI000D72A45B|nr:HK97-gp10 family putative phage morphogenesis protein [Listeria monocytogenes]EAD1415542.1 HK97 gp10 family phage protein [Listeria monocytogenes]EAD1416024.1 HK97 gp10 family phage protein [Listeria monocytogenes]EAD3992226.1 HK97 gp10 family phage protein [Listeria monocytogenes]EAD4039520.1 HK97 gp10 family phage protein [Listeria monocytogenes]EAD4832670.1 HK97 gp10 family phage protein [Listeria monocytogenes]
MAKVDIKMPDEFLLKVSKLGSDFDPVAEKILKAGGEVIFKRTKSNLSAVIGKGTKHESRSTGELEKALGVTSVRLDRNGNHNIKIGFSEPRPDGESNAKIANILEYGKHGQPAKPFLKPAKSASKSECISVMKSTFEEEVKKL